MPTSPLFQLTAKLTLLLPWTPVQALRSFKLTITVDPKYHPKIIGRKGAIITNIRTEHEVNIQFPEKNDENQVQFPVGCISFSIFVKEMTKAGP